MGYGNPDLDELSDERLLSELERRVKQRSDGLCIYCKGKLQKKPGCMNTGAHMQRALVPGSDTVDQIEKAIDIVRAGLS